MRLLVALFTLLLSSSPAIAQLAPNVNPAFVGRWCAQGDPTRVASIAAGNFGLQLTNETGSTSPAQPVGLSPSTIVALQWDLVQGTLSPDTNRISWTNGTYWTRCSAGGNGTISGTWYANGNPSRSCSITQQYGTLNFVNDAGVAATGAFDGPRHFTATWSGTAIGGTISADGTRIDWDNGTFWSR